MERQAPLHFNTILMRRTLPELPAFLRLAKELDAQHVTVAHLVRMVQDPAVQEELLDRDEDSKRRTIDALLEAAAVARAIDLSVNLPPPFALKREPSAAPAGPKPDPIRCWFLWQRMYVGPYGDVVPCCLAGIHVNGNVKGSDFFTQWNGPIYREMRRRVHTADPYGACRDCYLIHRTPDGGDFDKSEQAASDLGI